MPERKYWDNFTHYLFLFACVAVFTITASKLAKVGLQHAPAGMQEALAA